MKRAWSVLLLVLAVVAGLPAFGAEIEIVSPSPHAGAKDVIQVVVTVTLEPGEEITAPVVQTIDGQRFPLSPQETENGTTTYAASIDTRKLPNGRQSLMVLATPKGVDARRDGYDDASWGSDKHISAAEVPVGVYNSYTCYWGDIHAHTSYSDGAWLPKEAYEFARDTAKLDFLAVTDHAEILTMEEYADVVAQANAIDEPGRFAALYGAERTHHDTGHICFYMSPTHALPADLSDFYRAMGEMGLVGHFNHPSKLPPDNGGWYNDFEQFRYVPEAAESMAMVEVRGPEEEECYIALLDSGWRVGAAGDVDAHSPEWGQGPTWTVALARELTRESILEAFRARRTYSAADRDLEMDFMLDGVDMGSEASRPAGQLWCGLAFNDRSGDVIERIDVILDGEVAASQEPGVPQCSWSLRLDLSPGRHYCFVRVTQNEDRVSWSSPIWVNAYEPVLRP
jgi:hypothetical protein